jgi:small-conductance mechanosensitive channel
MRQCRGPDDGWRRKAAVMRELVGMSRRTRTGVRGACVALVAFALLAGLVPATAQSIKSLAPGSGAPAAPADAAPASVEALSAAEIAIRADTDERFVQEVMVRARQKDPGTRLGPPLDELDEGIAGLDKALRELDLQQLSVMRLESIESYWEFYQRELQAWRRELERVSSPYIEDAATLAKRRAVWEATRDALAGSGVASALRARVDNIVHQIALAEQALSGPIDAQIKLGRRANAVQARIDAGKKGIDAAIQQYDLRLGTIDAPPVWDAWRDTTFTEGELRGAAAGLHMENAFLREWLRANPERIRGYQVTVLVLLPMLLWLAWRSRKVVATDPGVAAAARVLRRPLSAWLVLALIGVPFFFPDAPLVLHQLALLLALVPVLRLLPPRIYEVLGAWPYVATALYVAYRLSFLLLGQPLYYRLYLLGVAILSAGALVWMLVSLRKRSQAAGDAAAVPRRLETVLRFIGWAAVAALLVAIGANAVGNVTLAEMLTGGVLDSTYIGLALFAGANVLSSVLNLLLARRSISRFAVITQHAGPLLASASRLIMIAAFAVWIFAMANEFRIARPVYRAIKTVLTFPLEVGQISVTLGSILLFVVAIWIAFWVAKTVRIILRDEVLPKMELPRGVGNSVSTLSYYGLAIVGVLIALAAAGFETSQFAIVFGALGIGIGLGLQNVVNNFVSGLILMFERPIQPGDVVEVSGTSGKVREIGMRATTLTTFEGADVVVPNGTLLSEKLINWTLSDMNRRIDVELGVAYGSDPRRVIALLTEVAAGTPGVAAEPVPAIVFKGFGANSLDFGIRAWTNDFGDWVTIRTEMTARVYEALQREGLEIPFPQQDLHLRSVSPEVAAQLGGARPA